MLKKWEKERNRDKIVIVIDAENFSGVQLMFQNKKDKRNKHYGMLCLQNEYRAVVSTT